MASSSKMRWEPSSLRTTVRPLRVSASTDLTMEGRPCSSQAMHSPAGKPPSAPSFTALIPQCVKASSMLDTTSPQTGHLNFTCVGSTSRASREDADVEVEELPACTSGRADFSSGLGFSSEAAGKEGASACSVPGSSMVATSAFDRPPRYCTFDGEDTGLELDTAGFEEMTLACGSLLLSESLTPSALEAGASEASGRAFASLERRELILRRASLAESQTPGFLSICSVPLRGSVATTLALIHSPWVFEWYSTLATKPCKASSRPFASASAPASTTGFASLTGTLDVAGKSSALPSLVGTFRKRGSWVSGSSRAEKACRAGRAGNSCGTGAGATGRAGNSCGG
mmetsp:Transcript_28552/g.51701  ORF Transcript_28552/g.51701 Transcript_28552/m.51701 type:complete len:343 (+) Transcript_28552:602-1630(+)